MAGGYRVDTAQTASRPVVHRAPLAARTALWDGAPATGRHITRPSRLRRHWCWCLPTRLRCRCLTKPSTASQRASVAGCQKASHLFFQDGFNLSPCHGGFLSSAIESPAPSFCTFLARSSLLRFGVLSVQGNRSLQVLFCSRNPRLVRKSEQ